MPPSENPDAAEAIASALARMRGRRGPRPPWDARGGEDSPPWMRGGPRGGHHQGGPHGTPPWGPHARFTGPARLRLLDALSSASHPLSVSEVAEAIGVDQPRASRLVQQSVDMHLVRREADPDDARRTRVALTEEGAAIVRRFRGDRRETITGALAGFTDAERAELARLITKLADAWPSL